MSDEVRTINVLGEIHEWTFTEMTDRLQLQGSPEDYRLALEIWESAGSELIKRAREAVIEFRDAPWRRGRSLWSAWWWAPRPDGNDPDEIVCDINHYLTNLEKVLGVEKCK